MNDSNSLLDQLIAYAVAPAAIRAFDECIPVRSLLLQLGAFLVFGRRKRCLCLGEKGRVVANQGVQFASDAIGFAGNGRLSFDLTRAESRPSCSRQIEY